jgi:hypothetical protein
LKNKEKKMTRFFHSDTSGYIKRRKYILWLVLLPLFQASLIAALIVIVNLRAFAENGFAETAVRGIAAAALAGTFMFFAVMIVTEHLISRNARYTFFEIADKALIFSKYGGDYINRGKRIVSRKLYVIPLEGLEKIGYNEKKRKIYLKGVDFRIYTDASERLNYKLSDGFPEFESWWYNQNGFTTADAVSVSAVFAGTDTEKLCRRIAEAKKYFQSAPKPKPYVHKEADFVRRRRAFERFKRLREL